MLEVILCYLFLCLCLFVDYPKKKFYKDLEFTKLEYHLELDFSELEYIKNDRFPFSSETMLFCYKFLKIVVFGHFHPIFFAK